MKKVRSTKPKKQNRLKVLNAFVCGRCYGHFLNPSEFADHLQAQTCSKVALIMNSIETQLVALFADKSQLAPATKIAAKKTRRR